jgi:hypothetical protein
VIVLAHVAGVPVEELLPTLATAGVGGLMALRSRLALRIRRRREPGR